jgi:hypothetical protein
MWNVRFKLRACPRRRARPGRAGRVHREPGAMPVRRSEGGWCQCQWQPECTLWQSLRVPAGGPGCATAGRAAAAAVSATVCPGHGAAQCQWLPLGLWGASLRTAHNIAEPRPEGSHLCTLMPMSVGRNADGHHASDGDYH